MEFTTYLESKKIDWRTFSQAEQRRFQEFQYIFEQVHPDSFTAQKLFLINQIRRRYPLVVAEQAMEKEKGKANKVKVKPKLKKESPDKSEPTTKKPVKAKPKINMNKKK